MIYPSSSATDLEGGNSLGLTAAGTDTWLFFGGEAGMKDTPIRGVVIFNGDVVISGSTYLFSSIAQGLGTSATGVRSVAQGELASALGNYSHAQGNSTEAVGTYSHAGGVGTIASGSGQTVVGAYNQRDNTTSLFVVGDGSADDDPSRRDVFRVNPQNVQVTGSMIVTSGITGSIERLSDGSAYIVGVSGISVVTNSGGQVEIGLTTTSPFTEFSGIAAPADDTPEAIFTLPLTANDMVVLEAQVMAVETTPLTNRAYFNRRVFAFGGAISATLDQESITTPDFKTDATWGVNFAVSGSNVVLWVTGAVANPTDWTVSGRYSNIQ